MPDELLIRTAKYSDAPMLAQFNVAMAWETEHKQLALETVTKGVNTVLEQPEHGFYVVAEQHGDVIASLLVTYEWSDWRCARFWWIQSVYVKPECRAQGVFRRLYAFLQEEALRTPGVCGFRLYVEQSNHTAQRTYTRMAMEKASYEFYESLFDDLEILGILNTQQGTGTFVGQHEVQIDATEKQQMLKQICDELVARGNQYGFTLREVVTHLHRRLENGNREEETDPLSPDETV